ncbi:MAG: hypothetical protein NXI24_18025 [bacterium]|nr:hypothetical protein [bacterium]
MLSRAAAFVVLAGGLAFAGACTERPSQEECLQSLENFLRLNTGSILSDEEIAKMAREAMSQNMASRVCVENKSRTRVLCEIAARNLSELRACEK